jgi:hypothetical protein
MYLIATRPDIMFATRFVSIFMNPPRILTKKVGKIILRYVEGTLNYGLRYTTSEDYSLAGYIDNDFAGTVDDRKNTFGYFFHWEPI